MDKSPPPSLHLHTEKEAGRCAEEASLRREDSAMTNPKGAQASARRVPSPPPFGILRQLYPNRKEPECRIATLRHIAPSIRQLRLTLHLDSRRKRIASAVSRVTELELRHSIQKRVILKSSSALVGSTPSIKHSLK